MRKSSWLFILLCLIIGGAYIGVAMPRILATSDGYSGRVVFDTEKEYVQFKQYLITTEATWQNNEEMQVLASSPPIIVKFDVKIPQNQFFPYGEKYSFRVVSAGLIALVFVLLMLVCFLILTPFKSRIEGDGITDG